MRRLTPADYRRMPWRNGGGTTTEIAIAPESAVLDGERFLYRVSIADVASDGPFSRFEGYDRHIMLLAGAGMTLDCGVHGSIELTAPFEPRAFSGDWDVRGELASGAVRDFNLIVDRERASSTLGVRVIDAPQIFACAPGTTCIIHIIDGTLSSAAAGDTLVAAAPFELVPRGFARVAIARIVPAQTLASATLR
jgi:environmental stress-induced protein Ves